MPAVEASVIIVTHQSRDRITQCLDALAAQDAPPPFEVVIVDNGSTDGTAELAAGHAIAPRIHRQANLGFGAGCNAGARIARGRTFAFLNPDSVPGPAWLGKLLAPLDDRVRLTTSKIVLMSDPGRVNAFGNELHVGGLAFARGLGDPTNAWPHNGPVPLVSGAAFAIRRDDLDELGGFDESFFLYLEDTDLSLRARRLGWRILGVADSVVRHDYAFRTGPDKLLHITRGRALLIRKHVRTRDRCIYAACFGLTRALLWLWALRHGRQGRAALREGRRQARQAEPGDSIGPKLPLHAIAVRRIRFARLRPSLGAWTFGVVANAVFLLNTVTWPIRWRGGRNG